MHFPPLGRFLMPLSPLCVYFSASSKFGKHGGSANTQNHSAEYLQEASSILQQASSILQQACDAGAQGLQGLLYATEVRPLQSRLVQHKYCQIPNTSNSIQQT